MSDDLVLILRVTSSVSAVSSLSVLITCVSFKVMRENIFARTIGLIAACDVVVSLAGIAGFPSNHSDWCTVQGALTTFFLRANWLWTTVLVIQMHRFLIHYRTLLDESRVHVCVWSVVCILTFLPLIHGVFGRDSTYGTTELCFISSSSIDWVIAWEVIDWASTVFTCIFIQLFLITKVLLRYRTVGNETDSVRIRSLLGSLYVYPLVLLVTWGVSTFTNVVLLCLGVSTPTQQQSYVAGASNVSAMLNGLLLAVVFFAKSSEARSLWKAVLCDSKVASTTNSSNQTAVGETIHNTMYDDTFFTERDTSAPDLTNCLNDTFSNSSDQL
jgi:hypothetical protein